MEKLAEQSSVGKNASPAPAVGPADPLPPAYWDALLRDAGTDAGPPDPLIRTQRLSEITRHLLRVTCSRCNRIVEIQKADAARLYGAQALWKDVGQRLLDNTCKERTGRHEEDGCWASFE
ncbi:hypothetical protein [Bradyrhizobium manausense]|uniref:hypothetical protein n=1 Tax=Bradyrhizobium manausense TaxID=989370 RepID=UPI002011D1CF|nr:hypothetical protein [Bradyrhizobium manausense]